jgi:hypothetical protein
LDIGGWNWKIGYAEVGMNENWIDPKNVKLPYGPDCAIIMISSIHPAIEIVGAKKIFDYQKYCLTNEKKRGPHPLNVGRI